MVHFVTLFGAVAVLAGVALGVPLPDSAINEPAVSAPNGIILTDTIAAAAASTVPLPAATMASPPPPSVQGSSWQGSSYGSPSSQGSSYGSSSSSYGSSNSSPPPPSYGSGSSNWGSSWNSGGYNNCVSQCMVTYGQPPSTYTPPTATASVGGTSGNGVTHTVIVAPTQGVLRYVPFAVNASVGDTIQFMWGANNHTVTKSSQLTPCNKTSDSPFTSGRQNKGFMFNQVVNTTDTTFFYCGVPTHCQKGMFGIINPPSALGSSTSMQNAMPAMAASNANIAAMMSYTNQQTASVPQAANWGNSIDIAQLPDWSHELVAENTMYTRTFLAANPEVFKGGQIDIGGTGGNPVMVPQDITAALTAAGTTTSASTPTNSATASSASSTAAGAEASSSAAAQKSGAAQLASPRVLLAVTAVVVTFLAL